MYTLKKSNIEFLKPFTADTILTPELDISPVTSSGFYCQS